MQETSSRAARVGHANDNICPTCGRIYTRAAHLARHLLTHSTEKPHICQFCGQQYQREDVLQRHMAKSCSKRTDATGVSRKKQSVRIRRACDDCHSKKLKCDGKSPCHKCSAKGMKCTYGRAKAQNSFSRQFQSQTGFDNMVPELTLPETFPLNLNTPSGLAPDFQSPVTASNTIVPFSPHVEIDNINLSGNVNHSTHNSFANFDSWPDPLFDWSFISMEPHFDGGDRHFNNQDYDFFNMERNLDSSTTDNLTSTFPNQTSEYDSISKSKLLDTFNQAVFAFDTPQPEAQERLSCWLTNPLIPRQYDLEILSVLIKIFHRHLDGTFSSYATVRACVRSHPTQELAMAAVGALFSDAPGSEIFARLFYTDSQRMLIHVILDENISSNFETLISALHTFIALEIFGLCGGHKRSVEMSQSFHSGLVQIMTETQNLLHTGQYSAEMCSAARQVIYDVFVLESYRVVLLHLQPILTRSNLDLTNQVLKSLETSAVHATSTKAPEASLFQAMASICSLRWFAAAPTIGEPNLPVGQFWRLETCEYYSQKFSDIYIRGSPNISSAKTLLHTFGLALHAPLEQFQDIAQMIVSRKRGDSDALTAKTNGDIFSILHRWIENESYTLGLQHTEQILKAGEVVCTEQEARRVFEAPHDAHCVYLATLTIMLASFVDSKMSENLDNANSSIQAGLDQLNRFQELLKREL